MIKPNHEQLQGVWENEDFPPFNYNKKYDLTFFIGDKYLSLQNDNNDTNLNIARGHFSIMDFDNYSFKIKIENDESNGLSEIVCRMYINKTPSSFVATIPNYGDIYFQKK